MTLVHPYNVFFALTEQQFVNTTNYNAFEKSTLALASNTDVQKFIRVTKDKYFKKSQTNIEKGLLGANQKFARILLSKYGDLIANFQGRQVSAVLTLIYPGQPITQSFIDDTVNIVFNILDANLMAAPQVGVLTDAKLQEYFRNVINRMPLAELPKFMDMSFDKLTDQKILDMFDAILARLKNSCPVTGCPRESTCTESMFSYVCECKYGTNQQSGKCNLFDAQTAAQLDTQMRTVVVRCYPPESDA